MFKIKKGLKSWKVIEGEKKREEAPQKKEIKNLIYIKLVCALTTTFHVIKEDGALLDTSALNQKLFFNVCFFIIFGLCLIAGHEDLNFHPFSSPLHLPGTITES